MKLKQTPKPIAIVLPPNAPLLDLSGPIGAFLEANRQSGGGAEYELCLISTSANKMVRTGGASLVADASIFDEDRRIDTLIIVGSPDYAGACESANLNA